MLSLCRVGLRAPSSRPALSLLSFRRFYSDDASKGVSGGPIPPNTKSEEEEDDKYNPRQPPGLVPSFAYNLNFSFVNYPITSLVTMPMLDMASIATTYSFVYLSGMSAAPELAVAVAISRMLRRFRLPLELANAAVLVKVLPPLSKVNVSALANVMPGMGPVNPRPDTVVGKSMRLLVDKVNEYGIGYFLSARFTGLAITTLIYGALRLGVDIDPLLDMLGTHKDQLSHVLGSYALALMLSSALYPVTLAALGVIVPRAGLHFEAPIREAIRQRQSAMPPPPPPRR